MELKWMAVGALALVPCAAMAQSKTTHDSATTRRDSSSQSSSASRRDTTQRSTSSTSTGDVSTTSGTSSSSQASMAGQNDAKIIGSPAWWKTHGTADGKPPINRPGTTH